ncbi:MAG: TlpA family protein disulfide reductase [Gammaproteobacteria bacterium]|nr:TlpA family protein disulfide reductase [Gammaproteobacteria bacterium]
MHRHPRQWSCQHLSRAFATAMVLVFATAMPVLVQAENSKIPHAGTRANEHFQQYQYLSKHKAFAIAPGGAWFWLTEAVSEEQAEQQALQGCQKNTRQKCVLYALNERVVFDADNWSTLWGPYAGALTASKASTGTEVGQRVPDLSWYDNKGKQHSVSAQKGKIVFLHFWGSWCPPCMREFPSLKKLHSNIQSLYPDDIEMKLLQLREPFEDSMLWAEQFKFSDMPLYDSGVKDSETSTLLLKDGSRIEDRSIARVFPSTYVLDRNGLVIFSHRGPVHDWLDYVAFFKHAVKNTVKTGALTANKHNNISGD